MNCSVLGSEVMEFADKFDTANILRQQLQIMTRSYIPLAMITHSFSLFDILTKASSTTEKRLMTDLETVQRSFNKMEIQDVAYIRSEYGIADALTKVVKQNILANAIESSSLYHPIQQWIVRDDKHDSVVKKRDY